MQRTRLTAIALTSVVALGAAGFAVPAGAATRAHAVNTTKSCSKGSLANLQLQREDNGTRSIDFGVDMTRHATGVPWRIKVKDNGVTIASRVTKTSSDGSFSLTRPMPTAASSHVTATATNLSTGEVCTITATL